jgi:hypothetical protein
MNIFLFGVKKKKKNIQKEEQNIWRISIKFPTFVALSGKKEFIMEMIKEP